MVDLADPKNPVMNTIRPPGYPVFAGSYGVGDVKSDDRYIYATDESVGAGVFIYDTVPDPMNPTLVATAQSGPTHNCFVDNGYLYTLNDIYDVSDPTNPVYVSRLGFNFSHDVMVQDGLAYLSTWNSGFEIWDVSTPRLPRLLKSVGYPGAVCHSAWPAADNQTLYTTDETPGGRVRIWDLSDLNSIREVGSWSTGPASETVHNIHVSGDLLFVTYYKSGLRVLDITAPHAPVEIAFFDDWPTSANGCFGAIYTGAFGVFPYRRDHVVVSDIDKGVYVVRIRPIGQTLTTTTPLVAPGSSLDIDFAYTNDATTPLTGFGLLLLTRVGGSSLVLPLVTDVQTLAGGQSRSFDLQIRVPRIVPAGIPFGFVGYTGLASPLLVSDLQRLTITTQ